MERSSKRARANVAFSNEHDSRLFTSLGRECTEIILRVNSNDPQVTELELSGRRLNEAGRYFNLATLQRLGDIIGGNNQLKRLSFSDCTLSLTGLCAGIQNNKCIENLLFSNIDLSTANRMTSLARFLTDNPSLREISLSHCCIGPAALNILSRALSHRTEDTLHRLNLTGNPLAGSPPAGIDMNGLVGAVRMNRELISLELARCEIGLFGLREYTSLATMLEDQESALRHLNLQDNFIDEELAVMFAASLSKNIRLEKLDLSGGRRIAITARGVNALVDLVCKRTSAESVMASNHTIQSFLFNYSPIHWERSDSLGVVDGALGALFRASLELNKTSDKNFVAQRKVLWSHFLGALNIGDSPIVMGKIPRILSCFGDPSDETIRRLVEHRKPPLPEQELATMRLDSLYRIVRSMPDQLCCRTKPSEQVGRYIVSQSL